MRERENPKNAGQYPIGIRALDRAGLRWTSGGVYLVLGGTKAGKTALLLEIAMRHAEMDPGHSARYLTSGSPARVWIRLLNREVERVRTEQEGLSYPPAAESVSAGFAAARHRVWPLIAAERLQLGHAPFARRVDLPPPMPATPEETLSDRPPSLVVVDGGSSTVSTPLEVIQTAAFAGVPPGAPMPPLVLSARVPTRHLHARHRGAIPYKLLASLSDVFDAADAVITLRREPPFVWLISCHVRQRQLDVPAASVELVLTRSGSIQAD